MAFEKLDSNGDGFIDLDELISNLPFEAGTDAATRSERLLEVIAITALHRKMGILGYFTPTENLEDEKRAGTQRLVQARRMMREADLNGDGKVSKEEFLNLLHETSVPDSLDQYDARLSTVPGQ